MNRWWVLFGILVAIPVILCVGLGGAFLIAGSVADNEYERRTHAVVATVLQRSGPNPTQITITEAELNAGFLDLPRVLLFDAGHVRFTLDYDVVHARGQGFLGSYLSFVYEPVMADSGHISLIPVQSVGFQSSFDTLGYSNTQVGKAIARGIERALAEAGMRPTAITSRGGKLTIDLEPTA